MVYRGSYIDSKGKEKKATMVPCVCTRVCYLSDSIYKVIQYLIDVSPNTDLSYHLRDKYSSFPMLLDYKSMNELIRYSALYVVNPALYNVFTKDIKDVISGRCRGHLYHLEKDGDVIIARVYRAYRGKIPPGLGKKYDMLIVGKIGNRIVYWAPVDLGALQRGAVVAEASETP